MTSAEKSVIRIFLISRCLKIKKEGIYGIAEDQLIIPAVMDSIVFASEYGRHGDLLLLYQNSKVGLRLLPTKNSSSNRLYVAPLYDKLLRRDSISSYDDTYERLHVFLFEQNGRIVLVGENGIRFCDD